MPTKEQVKEVKNYLDTHSAYDVADVYVRDGDKVMVVCDTGCEFSIGNFDLIVNQKMVSKEFII